MGMGLVDKIPDFRVFNVPLGAAAKGLVVWGVGDVIAMSGARFIPVSVPAGAVKIGVAALLQERHVKDLIGPTSANLGSLLLAVDGLSSFVNIRGKVRNTLAMLVGKALPAGNTGVVGPTKAPVTDSIPTFG